VVIALNAVVDRIGGMELEILLEKVGAKFSEFRHAGEISPKRLQRNFS
jgi:hypothetical protein